MSIGSVSSRPAATATWPTASASRSAGDRAGELRHGRQLRVVLDRHGRQAEPAAAAGDRGPGAVDDQVDRLGRQRPGDVGQQPAGHQHPAGIADRRVQLDPGRDLVVEPGDDSRSPSAPLTASIRTPPSTGTGGRAGRLRATQAAASARTSRSTRNFMRGPLALGGSSGDVRPVTAVRPEPAGAAHRRALPPERCHPDLLRRPGAPGRRPIHRGSVLVLLGRENNSSSNRSCG